MDLDLKFQELQLEEYQLHKIISLRDLQVVNKPQNPVLMVHLLLLEEVDNQSHLQRLRSHQEYKHLHNKSLKKILAVVYLMTMIK